MPVAGASPPPCWSASSFSRPATVSSASCLPPSTTATPLRSSTNSIPSRLEGDHGFVRKRGSPAKIFAPATGHLRLCSMTRRGGVGGATVRPLLRRHHHDRSRNHLVRLRPRLLLLAALHPCRLRTPLLRRYACPARSERA